MGGGCPWAMGEGAGRGRHRARDGTVAGPAGGRAAAVRGDRRPTVRGHYRGRKGAPMLDGRMLIDAHLHPARLPTLKPAWLEWAERFGQPGWRDAYDADGAI